MQHLSDAPRLAMRTDHYNSFHSKTAHSVRTNKNKSVLRSRTKHPDLPFQFSAQQKKICKLAINKQFAWQKSWRYCKDVKLHASKSCKVFQSGSQWSAAAADCTNLRTVARTMHHTLKNLQYIYPTKTQDGYFCCLVFRFNFGIPNSMPRRLRHLNRPQQVFFIPSNIGRNCTKELSSALGSQKIKQSRNAAKNNWSAMHMCSNSTV